jgi:hypothetical protein
MKSLFVSILISFAVLPALAQNNAPDRSYKLLSGNSYVKSKNTYLLTLFEEDKAVHALLKKDSILAQLSQAKRRALHSSLSSCKDGLCLAATLKFTSEEVKFIGKRLLALYKHGNPLDLLVRNHLIPSGTYILYKEETPAEQLLKAWEQDASTVNHIIGVYAEGRKPNYPAIDSISFNTRDKSYFNLMYDCSTVIEENIRNTPLFFEPSLQAALIYLEINEREDAGADEPMGSTVNKAALAHIKAIKWSQYPYSHILVPGAGPENLTTPLSAEGRLRCKLAASQYRAGKAPFIVVSGGNAHPFKTPYNEAIEMKRYLIDRLNIPVNAIIVEPHARHTTTNIRNDARLIFRYGIPFTKPGYIVTNKYQNDFIWTMAERCQRELNYLPYNLGKRISDTELEFYPRIQSLQIDADEPLDP